MLPEGIRTIITNARAVGVTGTRRLEHPALYEAVEEVARILVPMYPAPFVGDCSGVDRLVARTAPAARIVRARGTRAFHLVQRSVRMVDELREHPGALLIAFPWRSAPAGLIPSPEPGRCFIGLGSGTWATMAYAAGHGLTVAAWLPEPFKAPTSWPDCETLGEWLLIHAPRSTL